MEAANAALERLDAPFFVVGDEDNPAFADRGEALLTLPGGGSGDAVTPEEPGLAQLWAIAPAMPPERLGDASFRRDYGVRYAYVAGEMANGIASVELVLAMARAGLLGFFGAAGLEPGQIESAIRRIHDGAPESQTGFNLIHSPHDPALENATVDLYLRHSVDVVCASAYLGLTPAVVRYRATDLKRDPNGRVVVANRLIAKVSRAEVARRFLSPAPENMLRDLVVAGQITSEEAALAAEIPMCDDLTAEADSGGHTDNRPAILLIPAMIALRDEIAAAQGYAVSPRVGAAGGLATPTSVAAAFAMGAAYVVTGSVNQACREAGTSDAVRAMLADAQPADVVMAPAADMFEMGVQVQVLKRGTLFAVRAKKLYELYRAYDRIESIPAGERQKLETDIFKAPLSEAWASTQAYFAKRDPVQLERAAKDPRHLMALVFRSYLGQSSKWANAGEPTRRADYQIWCGPAMGAFNDWTRGGPLALPENREVVTIAENLMAGAAKLTRVGLLRAQGVRVSTALAQYRPRLLSK
ncbi:MAG: PfaD family polyunsaturated fatty acid/polyketide biosynthesis protein [Phycisphaerae bacterium]|nr:PfaD family polyunsaturated fatty acid/polyketide biosynthesis protein [Phycisphaerae bacterium]